MYKTKQIVLALLVISFIGCETKKEAAEKEEKPTSASQFATGIVTQSFDAASYTKVLYVNALGTSNAPDGSKESPYLRIGEALENSDEGKTAILVASGIYSEGTLELKEGVTLLGGFNTSDWARNINRNETILQGKDQERILVAANDTKIDGFIFSKGKVRGNGGAIYCNGTSPIITNNIFEGNVALGPQNWNPEFWHETANNGGAIYGENGASPTLKNNVFLNNKTENGRGAAVAFDNKCKVIISDNVFLNNIAGTDDPMRSSDGGGISIFNWCDAEISNNVFLGNKALARNDGGAVFVALWSSARIRNNIMVDSESGDDAGALFVGGQEHRYGGAALDPIPPKDQFYVTVDNNQFYGNKNSSFNSGAMRFTMESRGEFTNNRLAHNNGVYFQRSEVAVTNNIILDNFLFIETKEGLEQGSIEDNIIWGDFVLATPAKVSGNKIRDGYDGGTDNTKGSPKFEDDWKTFNVASAIFDNKKLTTTIYISDRSHGDNLLVNRVVRADGKWGIVKSNTDTHITLWGNLYGAETIQMLPTYTLID